MTTKAKARVFFLQSRDLHVDYDTLIDIGANTRSLVKKYVENNVLFIDTQYTVSPISVPARVVGINYRYQCLLIASGWPSVCCRGKKSDKYLMYFVLYIKEQS